MERNVTRRRFVTAMTATGATMALAGCGGGGDSDDGGDGGTDGDDGGSNGDDGTMEAGDGTESGGGATTAPTFDYTFAEDDAVVGGSLTGFRVDYPDGSGAVSDVSLGNVTLGGGDASRDIDDTTTSNNGSTYTIDFGGANEIAAGDQLVVELSNVSPPSGSYEVTATVNPQSGATEFTESF